MRALHQLRPENYLNAIDFTSWVGCHGNASIRKRLNAEMHQKPVLWNLRFILGNPSKLENVEGFPNIFEAFPRIFKVEVFPLYFEPFPFFQKSV